LLGLAPELMYSAVPNPQPGDCGANRECQRDGETHFHLCMPPFRNDIQTPPTARHALNVLGIQFEHVVVVVEKVQSPMGTRPDELTPHWRP